MSEIVASVQRVTDVIGEITAAAAEQSSGISRMNVSVGELDHMTQQNAALVDQVAAAADNLTHQTMRLQEALSRYKTGNDGVGDLELVHRSTPSASPTESAARRIGTPSSAPTLAAPPAPAASAARALPTPRRHADANAPKLPHSSPGARRTGVASAQPGKAVVTKVAAKAVPSAGGGGAVAKSAPASVNRPAAPAARSIANKASASADGDWETF
jgi:methyl-accepting chemotaxis protein